MLGIFGFVFGGIGLTVLGYLWGTPFNQWDSPPIFFRIFGSFIAIAFVGFGGTAIVSALRGKGLGAMPAFPSIGRTSALQSAAAYACPHCGAPLSDKTDVSPSGDVKCPFCHTWFNIHRPAT
jgi:hypothetical protein